VPDLPAGLTLDKLTIIRSIEFHYVGDRYVRTRSSNPRRAPCSDLVSNLMKATPTCLDGVDAGAAGPALRQMFSQCRDNEMILDAFFKANRSERLYKNSEVIGELEASGKYATTTIQRWRDENPD
jgi:hypothetical protein